jgi:hypothetical protein
MGGSLKTCSLTSSSRIGLFWDRRDLAFSMNDHSISGHCVGVRSRLNYHKGAIAHHQRGAIGCLGPVEGCNISNVL